LKRGRLQRFDPSPSRASDRFIEIDALPTINNLLNFRRFQEAY
jgi:hypothetical protein